MHATYPANLLPQFLNPNIWPAVQIMKPLVTQFPPPPYHFIPRQSTLLSHPSARPDVRGKTEKPHYTFAHFNLYSFGQQTQTKTILK
jgi:hypothetical protein